MSAATDACQRLRAERDRARAVAVALEQEVAQVRAENETLRTIASGEFHVGPLREVLARHHDRTMAALDRALAALDGTP